MGYHNGSVAGVKVRSLPVASRHSAQGSPESQALGFQYGTFVEDAWTVFVCGNCRTSSLVRWSARAYFGKCGKPDRKSFNQGKTCQDKRDPRKVLSGQ